MAEESSERDAEGDGVAVVAEELDRGEVECSAAASRVREWGTDVASLD